MSETVSYNLRLTIGNGQLERFRALMDEMVGSTKAEPGTLCYEWFLGADGTTCHINERYADSAAFLAHMATFGPRFAERFLACATPTSLSVYGDPSPEARAAFDSFGAVYLAPFGGFAR